MTDAPTHRSDQQRSGQQLASLLVVDDAPENIELLSTILRPQYRVLAATDGRRALEIANGNPAPDLILLDVSMPEMDGYEVCRRLKENPATARIPVLFVTARDSEADEVAALDMGAEDYLTKPINPALVKARVATHLALYDQSRHLQEMVEERTRALEATNKALQEEMQQREIALKRIHELRDFDPLTGLPNRDCMTRHLSSATEEDIAADERFGIVCLDIARFSQINSSHGHEAGNLVLTTIAERLSANVDASEMIGRIGSDSFAVLLRQPRSADAAGLRNRTRAVVNACRTDVPLGDDSITLDLAAGIAMWPDDGNAAEELLQNAEAALNHAVTEGGGALSFFSARMNETARENTLLESRLRKAIDDNALEPYYQPQISMQQRRGCGVEALLRWPDGEGGFINPGMFIPLAEDLGLIDDIGRLVQHKCFVQLRDWQKSMPADFVMSINLSAREFGNDRIVEQLDEIARDAGCVTSQIELEVTEHALIHDHAATVEKLKALRALGFRLSLDDFGTGYSSLAYVKDFPLNKLKVDRSFINDMLAGHRAHAIVETIIALAQNLEMTSVAEGVETEEQMTALTALGCGIAQGFLYSPALPPSALEEWWRKHHAA